MGNGLGKQQILLSTDQVNTALKVTLLKNHRTQYVQLTIYTSAQLCGESSIHRGNMWLQMRHVSAHREARPGGQTPPHHPEHHFLHGNMGCSFFIRHGIPMQSPRTLEYPEPQPLLKSRMFRLLHVLAITNNCSSHDG